MSTPAPSTGIDAANPGDRVQFGRLDFITGTRESALARLREWSDHPNRAGIMIGFINPHVYNSAVAHPVVAEFLRRCRFVCVDGVGVTVAARLVHRRRLSRVVATEVFDDLVRGLSQPTDAVLIGTTAGEVSAAATRINGRAAGLRIVATIDGFRDLDEYAAFFAERPDIGAVLVGAGSPKSEEILLRAHTMCPGALAFHIGAGTIKLYAGTKRKAPRVVSRLGLEWAHRIVFEPHTRKRYTAGAWAFARDVFRTRKGGAGS